MERLREEIFYLAYHLHWSWSEIMELPSGERRVYVRRLAEQIQTENRMIEARNEQLRRR